MNGQVLNEHGWEHLETFDWRNVSVQLESGEIVSDFVASVPDQGKCGACYAMGATSMLTSRLMIQHPELHAKYAAKRGADRISTKQQLSCNSYNQGCAGGYPYLVSKWSYENDLYSEMCVANKPDAELCESDLQGIHCEDRFRVPSWRYIGGALGRCGMHHICEAAIREELYKGGPVVGSMDVERPQNQGIDLLLYSGGVLHALPGLEDPGLEAEIHTKRDLTDCIDADCFIFRKVSHAVLFVGWGEDQTHGRTCQARFHSSVEESAGPKSAPSGWTLNADCEKLKTEAECTTRKDVCVWRGFPYWVLQNSWGPHFGMGGYFQLGPRGQNPRWLESFASAADVEWVRRRFPPAARARSSSRSLEPGDETLAFVGSGRAYQSATEFDNS